MMTPADRSRRPAAGKTALPPIIRFDDNFSLRKDEWKWLVGAVRARMNEPAYTQKRERVVVLVILANLT